MYSFKKLLLHNWHLKLVSLGLATTLWVVIAQESSSEIPIQTPLEYINVPANTEMTGDSAYNVEVWLRGPSALVRELSARDISTAIDLTNMVPGERFVPLTTRNIHAPFGAEVVRVTPARVKINLERTVSKMLRVEAKFDGKPFEGYRIAKTTISPDAVEVRGPENHVGPLTVVQTTPVKISGKRSPVEANVELELTEPLVRLSYTGQVHVAVAIEPAR
jgi:diadenylate cyclase